jgi:HSP20 family protein
MDLVDDPSSPNIIAIFELPGVKNEHISLQIKERRLMVFGKRVDPYAEALSAALAAVSGSQGQKSTTTNTDNVDEATSRGDAKNPAPPSSQGSPAKSTATRSIHELRYGSFFRSITVPEGIKV